MVLPEGEGADEDLDLRERQVMVGLEVEGTAQDEGTIEVDEVILPDVVREANSCGSGEMMVLADGEGSEGAEAPGKRDMMIRLDVVGRLADTERAGNVMVLTDREAASKDEDAIDIDEMVGSDGEGSERAEAAGKRDVMVLADGMGFSNSQRSAHVMILLDREGLYEGVVGSDDVIEAQEARIVRSRRSAGRVDRHPAVNRVGCMSMASDSRVCARMVDVLGCSTSTVHLIMRIVGVRTKASVSPMIGKLSDAMGMSGTRMSVIQGAAGRSPDR